jgi:hypothetical protein
MNKTIQFRKLFLAAALAVLLVCSQAPGARAGTGNQSEHWQELDFRFIEKLGAADFDQSQAKSTRIYDPGYGAVPTAESREGFDLWYYEWHVLLAPGQTTHLAYWLVPRQPGLYVIPPAQVLMNGQVYNTASWTITVQCQADRACKAAEGENVLTCPDDCPSGAQDSICDGVLDGKVDPDCEAGADPDEGAIATQPTPGPTPAGTRGFPWSCPGNTAVLALAPAVLLTVRHLRLQHRRSSS